MASTVDDLGGYDLKFLSEPPDVLQCLVCHSVAREPLQHEECGKLFCKSCLEKYRKKSKVCPNCREPNAQFFKDAKSNREIQDLKISCENSDLGCDWTRELRALKEHLTSCPYSTITCTNKCLTSDGEEYRCLRKDLDEHLKENCPKRKFECPHCQEEGTQEDIMSTHLAICPMVLTKCPNEGCTCEISSSLVYFHISTDCEHQVVRCRYSNVGCTAEVLRKDLQEHENDDKLHLHVLMRSMAELQKKGQEDKLALQAKIKEDELALRDLVTQLRLQMREDKLAYRIQLDMQRADIELMEEQLTSVFNELQGRKYKNFKLTNYRINKTPRKFPAFYSFPSGYRMSLIVYPNGNNTGPGTHLSVYVCMVKGSKDNTLKWPFCGTIAVTLLNQLVNEFHHTRELNFGASTNMIVGGNRGYSQFITHDQLDHDMYRNTQYLKDDTLYFRVSVRVAEDINNRPWLLV